MDNMHMIMDLQIRMSTQYTKAHSVETKRYYFLQIRDGALQTYYIAAAGAEE